MDITLPTLFSYITDFADLYEIGRFPLFYKLSCCVVVVVFMLYRNNGMMGREN